MNEVEKTHVELREAIAAAGYLAEKAQKLVKKVQNSLPPAESA